MSSEIDGGDGGDADSLSSKSSRKGVFVVDNAVEGNTIINTNANTPASTETEKESLKKDKEREVELEREKSDLSRRGTEKLRREAARGPSAFSRLPREIMQQ